jgi:hypothetical protein
MPLEVSPTEKQIGLLVIMQNFAFFANYCEANNCAAGSILVYLQKLAFFAK